MVYNDGSKVDENKRVTICPKCENESFNQVAEYCKICGTSLYNYCNGKPEFDDYKNLVNTTIYHKNDGDARFCEICGQHTIFFNKGFLKPWDEVKKDIKT